MEHRTANIKLLIQPCMFSCREPSYLAVHLLAEVTIFVTCTQAHLDTVYRQSDFLTKVDNSFSSSKIKCAINSELES